LNCHGVNNAIEASELIRQVLFEETYDNWRRNNLLQGASNTQIFDVAIKRQLILNDIQRIIYNEEQKPIGITPEMLGITIIKKESFQNMLLRQEEEKQSYKQPQER
jgi:hypothetical protein